ncbi:UNVERIFIED_CONTAM: hypothetical protein FKN15_015421, partial [Acipenser sinensis]
QRSFRTKMSQWRNKLSLADRVKVLEAQQNPTSSLSSVAAQFHIFKSQAGRISKNRDAILGEWRSNANREMKRKRKGKDSNDCRGLTFHVVFNPIEQHTTLSVQPYRTAHYPVNSTL